MKNALVAMPLLCLAAGCAGSNTSTPTAVSDAASVDAEQGDAGAADTTPAPIDTAAAVDMGPPSSACVAHCDCMAATCSTYSGYPYVAEGACLAHCAKFSAAEMKCWTYYCTDAKTRTGSTREHNCRHAWGSLGLEECPK